MKEKKNVKIDFRTSKSVKQEARSYPYTYEEIFILGLQCIRDEDTYKLMKIRESEEEIKDLQSRLDDYEILKHKLSVKEEELQNKRNELDVGDKFDVIEYNRNRKLNIVVEGLYSNYCRNYNKYYDLDKFLQYNNTQIQSACATNNLKTEQVIQKLKQKIQEEKE